jgi:hypothetical protein
MKSAYRELCARIVRRVSKDGRGILQHADFADVVASINSVLVKDEDAEPPPHTEIQEELVRLGMSESNARDVMLVYRALKVAEFGPP